MNKRIALAIEENEKENEIKIAGHFGHCSRFLVIELDENNVHNGSFYLYFNDAGYMVLALCGSNAAKTLDIKADETLQIVFE